MKHIGIDIGTSTVCGIVCSEDGTVEQSVTRKNDSTLAGEGRDSFRPHASKHSQTS